MGQALTLDIDPVIFSTAFLKDLSPDMGTENLWLALDAPE